MKTTQDSLEKLCIVIPESVSGQSFVGASLPPLGQVQLATSVKRRFPFLDVQILDGALIGQKKIEDEVKSLPRKSLLGISAHTSLNWNNCLKLLDMTSADYIVVGGIHTGENRCGRMIARDRELDVIQGSGVKGLGDYIEFILGNREKGEVENLIYNNQGNVIKNPLMRHSQEEFDFVDYDNFVNLNLYAQNFRKLFVTGDIGFTMISPEGCKWQKQNKKNKSYCLFCDIGTGYRLHNSNFFGQWVANHVEKYGRFGKVFMVNYADESSGPGQEYWENVLKNLPSELKPHENYGLKFYTKSGKNFFDSEGMARTYWDLGVEDIHVGFEAATNQDLISMHKGALMRDNYRLIDIVDKYKFRMVASFVLGAPTCSKKSLESCVDFMKTVRDRIGERLIVSTGSLLMPLPGSPAWDTLRRRIPDSKELFGADNPDLYSARKKWYEIVCTNLCEECGGVEEAMNYVQTTCNKLNKMGSLPTPENHYG